jgi:HK97 family phage portal protein
VSEKTSLVGPNRVVEKDVWTTFDPQNDLAFSRGGYLFGSRTGLFRLSISLICIDVLQQDVAKTPIYLRRRTPGGSEIVQPKEHPVARLLARRPNEYYGIGEFIRQMVAHLAIASEYYVPVRRNFAGEVIEFAGVPRRQVSTRVNPLTRKWYYDITPGTLHEQALYGWAEGGLSNKQCAHIRKRSMNGLDALSTFALSENSRELLESMQSFQTSVFKNNGMPTVAFQFPDELTDIQFDRLNKGINESIEKSKKSGKPIILEGKGGKVPEIEKLTMTSADADFVKSNIAAANEMLRYFRVPPHKAFLLESVKYDNLDSAERTYVDDTLTSYFQCICEGLAPVLLTEEEQDDYFLEFDAEMAFSMDPERRQKIVESRWKNGMITYDDMRTEIGFNAVGGEAGRVRMMSGNFVLVDEKNEVVLKAGGNAPNATKEDGEPAETTKPDGDKVKTLRVVQ